jgi:hypothetical protein
MRFQVLTAASMKMAAFQDIVPCSFTEEKSFQRRSALIIEAVRISET